MPLSNLYAALLHHAAQAGEEPWLFRSEGWDWRWHSWGELARQVTAWAGALSGLPPGSRAAFSYSPRPPAIALDLAIQAAGLVPVPVSGDRGTVEGCSWVEVVGNEVRFEVSPSFEEKAVEVKEREMMEMAEDVQRQIASVRRVGEREIVVLGGPLERREERAILSWATLTGAAVALEPEPGLRIATAAWVRPTVFHGTVEEIGALRAWAEKGKRRGLPFGRLRTVLVVGEGQVEDEAFWTERGVKVAVLAAERRNRGI